MAKLKTLYRSVKPGTPVTSKELTELGISNDLAVHYARAGWLTRLARGVFLRPESPLELAPSLRLLERRVAGLHIGGKSALDWHGLRHNLSPKSPLRLYGSASASLPPWFTKHFPESSYHRLRIFDEEDSQTPIRVRPFQDLEGAPLVSDPERAVLELLSQVGVRQPLQEARDLLESTPWLRATVFQELLALCKQVKTVRLCLTLGRELALPWAVKLDPSKLPTGSAKRWVSRTKEGLLVLEA